MFSVHRNSNTLDAELYSSQLYDQDSFYDSFMNDLGHSKHRVIIESPFITMRRLNSLMPILKKLRRGGVRIIVNTKPYEEHDQALYEQTLQAVAVLQDMDVIVLMTVGHHRKLAIMDDDILWEGSLNILSQNDSCEEMRRIRSPTLVEQMVQFLAIYG